MKQFKAKCLKCKKIVKCKLSDKFLEWKGGIDKYKKNFVCFVCGFKQIQKEKKLRELKYELKYKRNEIKEIKKLIVNIKQNDD